MGLGARWEASLHPSGLEGIQQSGSYKGVSARGRRRGQGQGQGPTGQNPSLAQDAGLPGGVRRWAGGPGKEATTVLAPLPPSACVLPSRLRIHRSSELALRLLGCFLPLYRVLFGIRKGSASSSWRQEGACSQGHLQLGRGRRGGSMSQPRVPSRARDPAGGRKGAQPFPKPSKAPTQNQE